MNNKNVIVTGSSRGIGRAIALELARNGYNILINSSKSQDELTQVKNEILAYGVKCEEFTGDIGDHNTALKLLSYAHATLGTIDILINNAGISKIGLLQDMNIEEWDTIMRTNVTSAFNLSKLVIPDMLTKKSGHIINISSVWGLCGASCEVAYSTTKGAINAFTKALGKELAPSGIRVNAIACGAVDTSMNSCFSGEDLDDLCNEIPAGRMATPDEVAGMVRHIIDAPSYLTGAVIKMDGGWI